MVPVLITGKLDDTCEQPVQVGWGRIREAPVDSQADCEIFMGREYFFLKLLNKPM